MITIEGLNKKQRALADVMWAMDSTEQVRSFISALHPKDRQEAQTVCEMMILAAFDQVQDTPDASQVIQQFRLTK
jgi:hypothetical protein